MASSSISILLFSLAIMLTSSLASPAHHLHFYLHDILSGPNATAIKVVPTNGNVSATNFGDTTIIDDPLTESPEPTSKLVGRAQGFYSVASLPDTEVALLFTFSIVFVEGKYNGSTLSVISRDAIFAPVRELPVVGGTGVFRMGRGYALMRTHVYDVGTGDAVLELDVYVDV